ncbi:phosphatidate cytidylyltransferase [Acidobacteria bacterium AH-259-D05]|nr:phosphatidate cytidylyltransferase [Acidobacteria bacterium AH-259-D05]
MIRRVATAAVLLPLVLLAIQYLPSYLFLLFTNLLIVLGLLELLRLLVRYEVEGYWLTFPLALCLPWIWNYRPAWLLHYLVLTILLCMVRSMFRTRQGKARFLSMMGNLLAILYISMPLSIAGNLQSNGTLRLLLILSVIWVGDSAAYWVGKKWGKHKVTPRISPHKSLEGYFSGFLGSVLAAVLFGHYFLPTWSIPYLVLSGGILALAGMAGDLFESMLKRGAGLKDSSNLLPGHGGVLDRIDSLLFALPTYYAFLILVK